MILAMWGDKSCMQYMAHDLKHKYFTILLDTCLSSFCKNIIIRIRIVLHKSSYFFYCIHSHLILHYDSYRRRFDNLHIEWAARNFQVHSRMILHYLIAWKHLENEMFVVSSWTLYVIMANSWRRQTFFQQIKIVFFYK